VKKIKRINIFSLPWFISIIAFLGSLYFSEVRNFIPCNLCWYQRILMYPLVILLFFGTLKKDRNVLIYSLPFAIIGFFISMYHYSLQKFDFMKRMYACEVGEPCDTYYINWLGFITIPFLAFLGFTLIIVSVIYILRKTKNQ
jgi:disulfide bond formation protein DsbB